MDSQRGRDALFISIKGGGRSIQGGRDSEEVVRLRCRNTRRL
jgi:hypothetical protein